MFEIRLWGRTVHSDVVWISFFMNEIYHIVLNRWEQTRELDD
jgi:hypothetical protein